MADPTGTRTSAPPTIPSAGHRSRRCGRVRTGTPTDRKSTRLNSSHPSIPLFPYTTLFRSVVALRHARLHAVDELAILLHRERRIADQFDVLRDAPWLTRLEHEHRRHRPSLQQGTGHAVAVASERELPQIGRAHV